jgi:6-pyruvoyl-tetrahydropterin synthase
MMGVIYEAIRKEEDEELSWETEDDDKFISFHLFIELLELYADDRKELIIQYLINDDEFLKLDFYYYGCITVDKDGVEIDLDDINKKTSREFIESLDYIHTYVRNSYDAYSDDDPSFYPTEEFLERLLEDDIDDSFNDKCWKIEDILELDCMKRIGLDRHSYRECEKALTIDARTTLSYIRERQQFKEKLKLAKQKAVKSQNIDPDIYDNTIEKLKEKDNEIEGLLKKIRDLEDKSLSSDNETMHPRTANNASKIIAGLASELLNIDLTQPYAIDSNGRIQKAIEKQGNTVSKDVIAYWLKLAHENSI